MNKNTPIQIVEKYYNRLLEYEAAAEKNLLKPDQVKEKLKAVMQDGASIEDNLWQDAVTEMITTQAEKRADLDKAAIKFAMYAEFYQMTNEVKLPTEALEKLKQIDFKDQFKETHSIFDNDFVRNEGETKSATKQQLEYIYNIISKEID